MIIKKEIDRKVQVIDAVHCNMCGGEIKTTETIPGQFEFATLHAHWGYGSVHDGERFHIEFCEDCIYRRLLPVLIIQPAIEGSI